MTSLTTLTSSTRYTRHAVDFGQFDLGLRLNLVEYRRVASTRNTADANDGQDQGVIVRSVNVIVRSVNVIVRSLISSFGQ